MRRGRNLVGSKAGAVRKVKQRDETSLCSGKRRARVRNGKCSEVRAIGARTEVKAQARAVEVQLQERARSRKRR